MASNVNVWMTNWQWTGVTVPTPQASVNLQIEWVDDVGVSHTHSELVKFPNILSTVPISWLKQHVEQWMLLAVRKKLGIIE